MEREWKVFFVGKSKEGGGDIERVVKELWRVFKDATSIVLLRRR